MIFNKKYRKYTYFLLECRNVRIYPDFLCVKYHYMVVKKKEIKNF